MKDSWENMKSTQVGNIGERIISELLNCKVNKHPYCGHEIDFTMNDEFFVEVKTKPRKFASNETGFDTKNYKVYLELIKKYKRKILIYFVDEFEQCIYHLELLPNSGHSCNNQFGTMITYFNLSSMIFDRWLSESEVNEFKSLRNKINYHWNNGSYDHTKYFYSKRNEKIKPEKIEKKGIDFTKIITR